MLEDFIASNNLQATVLPYPAKGRLVRCRLFSCGKEDALVVFFARDKVSEEKLKKAMKASTAKPIDNDSIEAMTGYEALFLPPISVYGVKVLLDKKLEAAEKLRFLVSEEKTLEISPKELLEANEDSAVADVTL